MHKIELSHVALTGSTYMYNSVDGVQESILENLIELEPPI